MPPQPTISIVMPVYNVAPYLRECLDSVRAQSFANWECICVDDGSTDDSLPILDGYAAKDHRFRILRHGRSNAGAARNFGMARASGTYLMFLDSDDVFSPWMFETLLAKADETAADIVACEARWFRDGDPPPVFSSPDGIEWTDRTPDADWSRLPLAAGTMPWNKILRHSFVASHDLAFLEQTSTNDLTFMALALSLSRKTFHTKEPLVGYRRRSGSIQSGKSRSPENYLRAIKAVSNGLRSHNRWNELSSAGKGEWLRFCARVSVWELSTQTTFRGYASFYMELLKMAQKFEASGLFPSPRNDDLPNLIRYRNIAKGGMRERFRAVFEACFAPFLGNLGRSTGVRSRIANKLACVRGRLFGRA